MKMTKHRNILGLGLALTILVLAGGTTAAAKTNTLGAPSVSTIKPAGYKLVSSGFITIANGTQALGRATCPRTSSGAIRRPQSGGVFISSSSLFANVNSSFPDGDGVSWDGYVNNASGFTTSFEVWAVCAKPRTGYIRVVTSGLSNPNGAQNGFTQFCPTGTKILGGGALLLSPGYANINSSYPTLNGWHVDANNGSGADETFSVYAVCSKYPSTTGYGVHAGSPVDNPPSTETTAGLSCPTGQSSLGGGVFSNSGSTSVNLNSTEPVTAGWLNYVNNATSNDWSIQAYVICAT
jgi:hypothetical protein